MLNRGRENFDRCIFWFAFAFAALALSKMFFIYDDGPMRHKPQGRVHAKRARNENGQ